VLKICLAMGPRSSRRGRALDEHDHHDLGILDRREAANHAWSCPFSPTWSWPRSARARLAPDVEAGMRAATAVPAVVDDRPQRLPQERQHHRREVDVPVTLPASPHTTPLSGRSMRCTSRGFHSTPTVGDGGHHARDLHGRHQHWPCPIDMLTSRPRATTSAALLRHLGLRDEPGLLAAELEPVMAPKPKALATWRWPARRP